MWSSFDQFQTGRNDRVSHCKRANTSMEGACTVVACGNGNTVPLTTPGQGKTWGDYVTINPDPSTSRKQPWKCTLCHHKYGKTSANASRVGQHVCGKEGNVKGCPGATHEDKKRFPRFISLPQDRSTVPSSSADFHLPLLMMYRTLWPARARASAPPTRKLCSPYR